MSKKTESGLVSRVLNNLYRNIGWTPTAHTSFSYRFFRGTLKIFSITLLKTAYDTVPFRARALALTAVLAVVPMLALGTAVLKGVGVGEESRAVVHDFLARYMVLNVSNAEVAKVPDRDAVMDGLADVRRQDLVVHLQQMVDKIFDYVNHTDFATLGFVGTLAILILVASFFSHLEGSMNLIWQVERGRSIWRRAVNYLTVLILLPIAMNLGFAAMAVLQSNSLMFRLENLLPGPWMVSLVLKLVPAVVVGGVFTALYKFLPNTTVFTGPAVFGGFLAGVAWLLVLLLYINLQLGVARYNAIYGSFATLPLVLLWIYVGWVIFLIGAEIVFALQVWRTCKTIMVPRSSNDQMAFAVDILLRLQKAWRAEKPIRVNQVAANTGYSPGAIHQVLETLAAEGCIASDFSGEKGIMPGNKWRELLFSRSPSLNA